ncbi:MAG: glycine zipper 2TM domain-containing protein [Pseudomonadota bacterium]
MENQSAATTTRLHPLILGAAASVILVSLLGAASITGVLPSSHAAIAPSAALLPASAAALPNANTPLPALAGSAPVRYLTPDGQVLEAVPNTQVLAPVSRTSTTRVEQAYQPAPVKRQQVVHHHHYAQNVHSQSTRTYQQPYATQQHPVQSYVSDMNPVGTGLGAVVGGLLGNQVGGGNGKKIATVAGVLLGGYAGNEVAHNRNPLTR